jgi:hypothetical protein
MKTFFEQVSEFDGIEFDSSFPVARIFHQKTGWYVGLCRSIRFEGGMCRIRVSPLVHFNYKDQENHHDPCLVGATFILEGERDMGTPTRALPFRFSNAVMKEHESKDPDVFIIDADDHKTALISRKMEDTIAVATTLGILPQVMEQIT